MERVRIFFLLKPDNDLFFIFRLKVAICLCLLRLWRCVWQWKYWGPSDLLDKIFQLWRWKLAGYMNLDSKIQPLLLATITDDFTPVTGHLKLVKRPRMLRMVVNAGCCDDFLFFFWQPYFPGITWTYSVPDPAHMSDDVANWNCSKQTQHVSNKAPFS